MPFPIVPNQLMEGDPLVYRLRNDQIQAKAVNFHQERTIFQVYISSLYLSPDLKCKDDTRNASSNCGGKGTPVGVVKQRHKISDGALFWNHVNLSIHFPQILLTHYHCIHQYPKQSSAPDFDGHLSLDIPNLSERWMQKRL